MGKKVKNCMVFSGYASNDVTGSEIAINYNGKNILIECGLHQSSDVLKAYNANVYGIWTLGVTKNSTQKENAVKLLEYLMDPEVQKETVKYGGVPCRYSSLKDPEVLEEFPQYESVCEALEGGVYRPIISNWTEFYTILGEEMDNIIKGKKDIDTGLKDAQRRLEEMK